MKIREEWQQRRVTVYLLHHQAKDIRLLTQRHGVGHWIDKKRDLSLLPLGVEMSMYKGFLTEEKITSLDRHGGEQTSSARPGCFDGYRASVCCMVQVWRVQYLSFALHLAEFVLPSLLLCNPTNRSSELAPGSCCIQKVSADDLVDIGRVSVSFKTIECFSPTEQGCPTWTGDDRRMFEVSEGCFEVFNSEKCVCTAVRDVSGFIVCWRAPQGFQETAIVVGM